MNRRSMLASAALGVAGLSVPAMLAACNETSSTPAVHTTRSIFPPQHPQWNFVFVNHAMTNPFFVAARYGIEDACNLLGCKYQWTGSNSNKTSEMIDAINAAIANKADGIAVSIIDPHAFDAPVNAALDAGIPVVTYNSDIPTGSPNRRMAYFGEDVFQSGVQFGQRIVELVPSGEVVGFIATPDSLNIQPRIDGAKQAIQDSGKPINFIEFVTGVDVNGEMHAIEQYYLNHPYTKGMFAVDAGSTQYVGQVMEKYALAARGVHAGGYDLQQTTLQEISKGNMDFTIDQQPYLQGFLPIVHLFLYKLSGGLLQPASTNMKVAFVTKENVEHYLDLPSRFEGSSTVEKVLS